MPPTPAGAPGALRHLLQGRVQRLSGWGRFPQVACHLLTPSTTSEAVTACQTASSLIARGNGRSYGDSALNAAATVSTLRLNRLLAFDDATGLLTAEAGLTLDDLLSLMVPRGWFPPVTPGTRFVTLGGMVAADVHGKNHHVDGSFGNHVTCLELLLSDGQVVSCAATENAELFFATIGGMGLTGVILTVTLRLRRIETPWILQETIRCGDLDETMGCFVDSASWTYSVAWIDCLATGTHRGRSLLYRGEHALRDSLPDRLRCSVIQVPETRRLRVPYDLPSWTLNGWTIRAFNEVYFRRSRLGQRLVDYETFFYPLDAILEWNRIYGARGFVQYQCVMPDSTSRQGLLSLLEVISTARAGSFLAVLKQFGQQGPGLLSFPMPGYTLALDFSATAATFSLLLHLDRIVTECGGRLYLAKDARMGAELMRRSYPGFERFRAIRQLHDPQRHHRSFLSERLDL